MSRPIDGAQVRLLAARAVAAVMAGTSLDAALEAAPTMHDRDRALFRALSYGTLRIMPRLDAWLALLVSRPLNRLDPPVRALLCVGLYQLCASRVPEHAAVAETVNAAKRLGRGASGGMVNAVLRRFLRERDLLERRIEDDEVARLAHPRWLLDMLRADWPEDYARVCEAGNQPPPMWLRIDLGRISRAEYRARLLQELGLEAQPSDCAATALRLEHAVDVDALPGFAEGLVSVQDAAAQLAAPLLAVEPGQRVLDACAAPGGKTAHLLELCGEISLTALDSNPRRLGRIHETLGRTGRTADVLQADAARPDEWWDGGRFDRILLDPPCSATGVIRRHPDIKLLRRPADVAACAREQSRLLDALWPLLASGGRMLYATCSVLRAENDAQMDEFVRRHPEARVVTIEGAWGRASGAGRQILSGEEAMDGFYYACVMRATISQQS